MHYMYDLVACIHSFESEKNIFYFSNISYFMLRMSKLERTSVRACACVCVCVARVRLYNNK